MKTQCDLVITANGKTEKVASGLLHPFIAHLKTAKDQIDKGGYSIMLKPNTDATWFTKGTIERFVRFVSTPEVLERVNTVESEISQIEEAIAIQGNDSLESTLVEKRQKKGEGQQIGSMESIEAANKKLTSKKARTKRNSSKHIQVQSELKYQIKNLVLKYTASLQIPF
ncbi:hypothetical protein GIB67_002606 [Kingdonia uniflora]|uniref:Uncharacterized protein n=1 Tax=Kingdonia uniflora TaxID=39325 RepID=A0A7J7P8X2_9MAGN|nr:hypothetical protein GIB67_002606 [Kingdonia uniflora]